MAKAAIYLTANNICGVLLVLAGYLVQPRRRWQISPAEVRLKF